MDDRWRFLYVLNGNMTCQVNQEKTTLQTGEGLFLNAGSAFRFTEGSEEGCEFYLFEIAPEYGKAGERVEEGLPEGSVFPFCRFLQKDEKDQRILRELREAGESAGEDVQQPWAEIYLRGCMNKVWAGLMEKDSQNTPPGKSAVRDREKLCKMLEFLHSHYNQKITLGDMAAYSGVSSGEYCRFFKKHMEQTPFEYLQVRRIECSLSEIVNKEGSLTEIALRHGFTGSSYYAETFKKEMGCTPGDYRKWYRRETTGDCPLKIKKESPAFEKIPAHLL
jgi:AraC-like DNA-binding protein